MGTGGFSPGVKLQGREADHSPPTSAEVKKIWIYASTPPYAFNAYLHGVVSQKIVSSEQENINTET
jgi:hypothetical protein